MSKQTEISTGAQVIGIAVGGLVTIALTFAVVLWIVPSEVQDSRSAQEEKHESPTDNPERQQGGGNIVPPVAPPANIFEAAARGTVQDVRHYIETGINVNSTEDRAWTPLHYAAESNSNVEVLRYLISQGGDVNAISNMGYSPLDRADTDEKKRILREAMGVSDSSQTPQNADIQQPRQTDIEARRELIAKATHIDTLLNTSDFSGNNAMNNLANFGTATLKTQFDRAYDTWSRASTYDKDSTKATFERVRMNIKNFTQREIATRPCFGNWTYRISDLVVNGSESSFTMSINVGFQSEKFRNSAIADTLCAFPRGVTATISEFGSSQIRIHVRGNTNVIREIDENKNNYNARVHFINFRSSDVPTFKYTTNSTSAEVLGIAIVRI